MPSLNLRSVHAWACVPSKDFEASKRFYQALGFAVEEAGDERVCLRHGDAAFVLQDFDAPGHAENFQMELRVENVDDWWRHVCALGIAAQPPQDRPWGVRDFALLDPSGVLWRIGRRLD